MGIETNACAHSADSTIRYDTIRCKYVLLQPVNYSVSATFCQILNIANSCFQVSAEAFWNFQNIENSSAAGLCPDLAREAYDAPHYHTPQSSGEGPAPPSSPQYAKTKVGVYGRYSVGVSRDGDRSHELNNANCPFWLIFITITTEL